MPSERPSRPDIAKQILVHATRLFAARGFVGASLRDIAKAVGIRKPSLLYHFPSKDELRRGVLEQMLARWNEAVPRLLKAATSGSEQFEAVTGETVQFFLEDPDRARLLLREMLDRPDEMGRLANTHVQPWAKVICDYIRKGQKQGRVHPDVDPEAYVAHMINLVVCGVAMMQTVGGLIENGEANASASPSANSSASATVTDAERRDATARHVAELLRVARSALFIDPGAASVDAPNLGAGWPPTKRAEGDD